MYKKSKNSVVYQFGDFTLCPASERLYLGSQVIKLEPQLYSLLWLFVQHPTVIVSRDTIEREVWMGRPVTDESIRAALKKLRDCLGDDARAPRYLKTIPRQGYKWLSPVTITKRNILDDKVSDTSNRPSNVKRVTIGAFVLLAFGFTALMLLESGSQHANPNQTGVTVTQMTALTGSEVNADFHQPTNKLAFLFRETKSSPQQLYIRRFNDNSVTRLSWDNANYSDSHWSADGSRLAFTRLLDGRYGFHIASFSDKGDVEQVETLLSSEFEGKFIIGWLHNDAGLLLAEKLSGSKVHGIFAYDFEQETMAKLTSPNVSGRGDYNAALSEDGKWLALLREEVAKEATLIVINLETGDVAGKSVLPFVPSRLVWHENAYVVMTSFFGDHARFSLISNSLTKAVALPENTLDVFGTCGARCYVMRQHNGNFLDLQEMPLAALVTDKSNNNIAPILQSGRLLKRAGAQDFPQYFSKSEGLFFVTLQGREQRFQVMTSERATVDVARLDAKYTINALALSPDDRHFVGISDGRIFHGSVQNASQKAITGEVDNTPPLVRFITTSLTRYENPFWAQDSSHLYVTEITDNIPRVVKLNTSSLESVPVVDNMLAFKLSDEDASKAYGVTPTLDLVSLQQHDGVWLTQRNWGRVPSASPNRWLVSKGDIYYTKHAMPEAFLCKKSQALDTLESEDSCWSIGDNRFRLQFDLHSQQQNLVLVESLGAQSDIIKLQW
jgi:DNA-binding winged helix-turn-helix (wHTH) protein